MQKLVFNEDLEKKLKTMKIDLDKIVTLDDSDSERIVAGACGGYCQQSCSWWCEMTCEESCITTSMMYGGTKGRMCSI